MEGKQVRAYTKDNNVPIADENDVLIVWDGSIGKTATGIKGAIDSTIAALTPIIVEANFLNAFLQLSKPIIEQTSRGTGLQHINPTTFWPLQFPLPPLNEQKRIIAKLDKIVPRVDTLRERLDRIPQIIKRFRQSVLTAAVTGKFTEEWRKRGENCYRFNMDSVKLKNVVDLIQIGPFGSLLHKADYVERQIPVINPININDGRIKPSPIVTITKAKQSELSKYTLQMGDIVVGRRGEMGRCAIVRSEHAGWLCGTGSLFVRPGTKIISDFLKILISSPIVVNYLNSASVGSTMTNLNEKIFSNIMVRVPIIEEQREIVRQANKLFAFADKLETHYKKAKEKIDKLPQSVLAKTFRGELVPQDPNDELASELLKKIIAEKEKRQSEIKKTKKRKVKSTIQKKGK